MNMEYWWNDTDEGKPVHSEKTCPIAILFTTNLTWAGLELHLGLCTKRPVNNCLSPNMAVNWLVKIFHPMRNKF